LSVDHIFDFFHINGTDMEDIMPVRRREESLTQERLREMVEYDPASGIFLWKARKNGFRGITLGMRAGGIKPTGNGKKYRYIRIDQVDYLAKRLAWFWCYNEWPSYLRCKDGDEDNCAISNLINQQIIESGRGRPKTGSEDERDARRRHDAEYKAKFSDRIFDQRLRNSYGIGIEDYNRMLEAQGGVCAICGKPETAKRNGKPRLLAVDHNHHTGKVRGLLCGKCNPMIGYADDDVTILERAAVYLRNFDKDQ
jgi:hypothetical protein